MNWTAYHVDFNASRDPILTRLGSVDADNLLAAVRAAQAMWPNEKSLIVRATVEDCQTPDVVGPKSVE